MSEGKENYCQLLQHVVGVHGKVSLEVGDGQESTDVLVNVGLSSRSKLFAVLLGSGREHWVVDQHLGHLRRTHRVNRRRGE